jgi:hypothetical protein
VCRCVDPYIGAAQRRRQVPDALRSGGVSEDLLSALPDDALVLVLILVLLGTAGAAACRTSVLSRRWRWVWAPPTPTPASSPPRLPRMMRQSPTSASVWVAEAHCRGTGTPSVGSNSMLSWHRHSSPVASISAPYGPSSAGLGDFRVYGHHGSASNHMFRSLMKRFQVVHSLINPSLPIPR